LTIRQRDRLAAQCQPTGAFVELNPPKTIDGSRLHQGYCRASPMTKRGFLKVLTGAALAGFWPMGGRWLARAAATDEPQGRPTKHFVWIRPNLTRSADDYRRDFALMRASGLSGIVAEIYNGSHAFYRSRRLPVRDEWLERVLPIAAAEHLEVHAWMWSLPCLLPDVLTDHPDWYNVNAKGESAADKPAYVDYYKFLDPARPEVRQFVRGTVRELAGIAGLTGIHLDYIRHPDAILPSGLWSKYGIVQDRVYPAYDYGYTDYSRRAFRAAHGIDPIVLPDPEQDREWLQYRLDTVVDLVNEYLVPAAHEGGKVISAAVFPGPSRARVMVRQDWGRFKLDAFFPMLYHTFYEAGPDFVERYTQEAVRTVTAPVYSGLYVGPLADAEFTRTVELAMAAGASGVSIFDAAVMTAARWALFARIAGR
jgi:uncharacterized lipoprotein YddW (UPF0748 family)